MSGPTEQRAYIFIRDYITRNDGISPSFREIMRGIGCKSLGKIHAAMDALESARLLRRIPGRRRAIQLAGTGTPIPIYDADTLELVGFLP